MRAKADRVTRILAGPLQRTWVRKPTAVSMLQRGHERVLFPWLYRSSG